MTLASHLFQSLFGKETSNTLRARLVMGTIGTYGIKIANTGLSFFISILLARLLGAPEYGVYSYVIAWIGLLILPATMGLDRLLVREVATHLTQAEWPVIKGLLLWANRTVLFTSVLLVLLVSIIVLFWFSPSDSLLTHTFLIALCLLPLSAINLLRKSTILGLHHIVTAQLPEMIIRPISLILLMIGAYLLFDRQLNAPWAMGLNVLATGIALVIGTWFLLKVLPQEVEDATPHYQALVWANMMLPMMFIGGMLVINWQIDILMLGALKGPEYVGIYNVARQGVQFITLIVASINTALGPTFARIYVERDLVQLQNIVTQSARAMIAAALPIASCLILFGYWFLLIFGAGFVQGSLALTILSISQLIHIALAPSVGLLLVMTGFERDAALSLAVSAALNVVLNALLIPNWGIEGAAIATATSRLLIDLLLVWWVYKRLRIHSTVVGQISLR